MPSSQSPSIAGLAIDPTAIHDAHDDAEVTRVTPAEIREKLVALRAAGFTMLLDIGGVDYLERDPRFDVVYHLLAMPTVATSPDTFGKPRRARVLCGVGEPGVTDAAALVVPSVVDLWPSADWAEREIFDLFGITFEGHPNLKRVQMPYDWEGHPLRKDYPLRGPAAEAAPRPAFASKSNVPAGAPPGSKVAAALQKQIARMHAVDAPAIDKDRK
jgi:NADH-quinone oxidoreductase subunit C